MQPTGVSNETLATQPYDGWWYVDNSLRATPRGGWAAWFVSPELDECVVLVNGRAGPRFPYKPTSGPLSSNGLKARLEKEDDDEEEEDDPSQEFLRAERERETEHMFAAAFGEYVPDEMDPEGTQHKIIVSPDGARFAYSGRMDAETDILWIDGSPTRISGGLADFGFSPDSKRWFASCYARSNREEGEEPEDDDPASRLFDQSGEYFLYVDGVEVGQFSVASFIFTNDSAHWAALGWWRDPADRDSPSRTVLMIDGEEVAVTGDFIHWSEDLDPFDSSYSGTRTRRMLWLDDNRTLVVPLEETDGSKKQRGTGRMTVLLYRIGGDIRIATCGTIGHILVTHEGSIHAYHSKPSGKRDCARGLSRIVIDPEALFERPQAT